jgi:hypothetical protein
MFDDKWGICFLIISFFGGGSGSAGGGGGELRHLVTYLLLLFN